MRLAFPRYRAHSSRMPVPFVGSPLRRGALALFALLTACAPADPRAGHTPDGRPATPAASTQPPFEAPAWARSATIYEVNTRQYTPAGTFRALLPELARIRATGADILWFMPIQPIGATNRKGTLGSYYSIADYTAVNPEFGTLTDFKAVVDSAHALGMKVILDWVANHTAFDHRWTREHPDWYTRRADGSISTAIDDKGKETDWTDVADLDYRNRAMRAEMLRSMRWWLEQAGIDGFRCDVAGFVPSDFWAEAREAVLAVRPEAFLLAEWEDPALHASFHATYGWELHHLLNRLAKGEAGQDSLRAYLDRQRQRFPPHAFHLTFTSNHDENSWNGSEFERMGRNHQAAFVVASTLEGAFPLVYSGQEASNAKRLRFFDKDTIDWRGASLQGFYATLAALKDSTPALHNGAWGGTVQWLTHDGGDRVIAFGRVAGASAVVVLANFGDAPRTVRWQGLGATGAYRDAFGRETATLGESGATAVPAHGWRVFVRRGE